MGDLAGRRIGDRCGSRLEDEQPCIGGLARDRLGCPRGRTGCGGRGRRAWGPRSRPGARASAVCSRAWRTPCPSGWPCRARVRCQVCGPRCAATGSSPRIFAPTGANSPTASRSVQSGIGRANSRLIVARSWSGRSPSGGPGATARVPTRVSAENAPGWSSTATWATIPPTPQRGSGPPAPPRGGTRGREDPAPVSLGACVSPGTCRRSPPVRWTCPS